MGKSSTGDLAGDVAAMEAGLLECEGSRTGV